MNKIAKEVLTTALIIIVVIIIRTFIVTPAIVKGSSMTPTLKDGEILLLKKYDKQLNRFDIVVVKNHDSMLVKRIIGLPGEHVEYKDSKLYINGFVIEEEFINEETRDFDIKFLDHDRILKDFYFVMGDNRDNSQDSRTIGLIHKDDIIGKTTFRLFPFTKIGRID